MISKATSGRGFKGSVSYITDDRKAEHVELRGVTSDRTAAKEMRAVAAQSDRVEKPVYHFHVAWAPGENPTREQMIEAADRMCDRLGLADHQRVYAIHHDTDHRHIHIVANRVHPETGRAAKLSHDYRTRETVCREIEREQGWQHVQGRHAVEKGQERAERRRVSDGEIQRERREGRQPFAQIVEERAAEALRDARSWEDLGDRLQRAGLRAEGWRQGLVITDGTERAKASSFGREYSRGRLEERFGETFAAYSARVDREPSPQIDATTVRGQRQDGPARRQARDDVKAQQPDAWNARKELWQQYSQERKEAQSAGRKHQGEAWDKEDQTRKAERDNLVAAQRQRREAIYRVTHRGMMRKGLLALDDRRREKEWRQQRAKERERWEKAKAEGGRDRPKTWRQWLNDPARGDSPAVLEARKRMERARPAPAERLNAPVPAPEQPQAQPRPGILDRLAAKMRDIAGRDPAAEREQASQVIKGLAERMAEQQRQRDQVNNQVAEMAERMKKSGMLDRLAQERAARDGQQPQQQKPGVLDQLARQREAFAKMTPQEQQNAIEGRAQEITKKLGQDRAKSPDRGRDR